MMKSTRRQLLLLAITILLSFDVVQPFSVPFMGLGSIFFKPKGMTIKSLDEFDRKDAAVLNAGRFFVDAFWTGKGGSKVVFSPGKRKNLENEQMAEFQRRYLMKLPNKRQNDLVIAENSDGDIMGCAGIEVDLIKNPTSPNSDITAPLMSNVAVGRNFRRRGIAEDLIKKLEDIAMDWGYDDIYLLVERQNQAAVNLYSKAGYRKIWEDGSATTLIPSESGDLKSSPTVITCMRKRLNGGPFSNFFLFKN